MSSGPPEQARRVIATFTQQNEQLIKLVYSLVQRFNGGLSRDDVLMMSAVERQLVIDHLKNHDEVIRNLVNAKKIPLNVSLLA